VWTVYHCHSVCVCVSRRTESGLSVDSLPLSHVLAADSSLNYESSDTDYEKTTSADDSVCASARKVV